VTFRDGRTVLGSSSLAAGAATLAVALAAGNHTLTATYEGGGEYVASPAVTLSLRVNAGQTTTALTSSSPSVAVGSAVTFTATVQVVAPAAGTPTGLVTFRRGTTTLARVALNNGVARFTTTALPRGAQTISAVYAGDTNFLTSTAPSIIQDVR
jgi:hypothetical protein